MQRLEDDGELGLAEALGTKDELQERLVLELFQARTDWNNAWAPAAQVVSMTKNAPIGVAFAHDYFPVVEGTLVRSSGRAVPQPVGVVIALDVATAPEELVVWTDAFVEDRFVKRLPPGTVVSASAVRVGQGPIAVSMDLRGGLTAGADCVAYTRDGYRGAAVVSEDALKLELPHPVAGSSERDARAAIVLESGPDPHDAVMRGASVSAASAGSMAEAYDLLRPFPVDVARRQHEGTTLDELSDALRAQGRELFGPTSGPAETASMRFLISRMADGVRPDAAHREFVEIGDLAVADDFVEPKRLAASREELARIKKFADVRQSPGPAVLDLSGATPWKVVREAKIRTDAESNRADAARTFHAPVDLRSDDGPARVPPLSIKDDGLDWSFVPGASELVYSSADGHVAAAKADGEVLGAEAEILAAFALVGGATGMYWSDDLCSESVKRLLSGWTRKVPDTAAVDEDVAALVEAGLDESSARVAALDAECAAAIGPAGKSRDQFVAEAAAECLANCVATSISIGRPAIVEVVSGRAASLGSVAGIRDYCASRLSDSGAFSMTAARRFHDLAAVALGRLPPNPDRLLRPAARTAVAPRRYWKSPARPGIEAPVSVRSFVRPADPAAPVVQHDAERLTPHPTTHKKAAPSKAPATKMTGLPFLKSCAHDGARAHRAATCAPAFVSLLRSRAISADQKAFTLSMDSKAAADFMARVADVRAGLGKRGSGVALPAGFASSADLIVRFVKSLQDAHPEAAALFDAYCAADAQAPKRATQKAVHVDADVAADQPAEDSGLEFERDREFDDSVNDVGISYDLHRDDSDGDD